MSPSWQQWPRIFSAYKSSCFVCLGNMVFTLVTKNIQHCYKSNAFFSLGTGIRIHLKHFANFIGEKHKFFTIFESTPYKLLKTKSYVNITLIGSTLMLRVIVILIVATSLLAAFWYFFFLKGFRKVLYCQS